MKEGRDEEKESWGGGSPAVAGGQNVVWGAVGGAERGGAQSDKMKGGEMKSLKRDEEEERAEHT